MSDWRGEDNRVNLFGGRGGLYLYPTHAGLAVLDITNLRCVKAQFCFSSKPLLEKFRVFHSVAYGQNRIINNGWGFGVFS